MYTRKPNITAIFALLTFLVVLGRFSCVGFVIVYLLAVFLWARTIGTTWLFERVGCVLFLRKFSSFADRSLLITCLKGLPSNARSIALLPRDEPPGNWDPFLLGLAGLKLLRPIRSIPTYLECSNEEWVDCIESLINKATLIVIDVTETTVSLRTELDLLIRVGALDRAIMLQRKGASSLHHFFEPGSVFEYECRRGVARRLIGLLISSAAIAIAWFLIPLASLAARWAVILFVVLTALLHWLAVFNKPLLTRSSSRALQRLIRKKFGQGLHNALVRESREQGQSESGSGGVEINRSDDRRGLEGDEWLRRRHYKLVAIIILVIAAATFFLVNRFTAFSETNLAAGDQFELHQYAYVYLEQEEKSLALAEDEIRRIENSAKWSFSKCFVPADATIVAKSDTVNWRSHGISQFAPGARLDFKTSGRIREDCQEGSYLPYLITLPELGRLAESTKTTPMVLIELLPHKAINGPDGVTLGLELVTVHKNSHQARVAVLRHLAQVMLVWVAMSVIGVSLYLRMRY